MILTFIVSDISKKIKLLNTGAELGCTYLGCIMVLT